MQLKILALLIVLFLIGFLTYKNLPAIKGTLFPNYGEGTPNSANVRESSQTSSANSNSQTPFGKSLSSVTTIKTSKGANVDLELTSPDGTSFKVDPETQFCGAPAIGSVATKGHYEILNRTSPTRVSIGTYEFVVNTLHNGTLHLAKLTTPSGRQKEFAYAFVYGSCTSENALLFALGDDEKTPVQYKFKNVDGTLQDGVCISSQYLKANQFLPVNSTGILETQCVDAEIGKTVTTTWKINEAAKTFEPVL